MSVSKTTVLSACLALSLLGNLVLGDMVLNEMPAAKEVKVSDSLRPILRYLKDIPQSRRKPLEDIVTPAQAALKEKFATLGKQRDLIARLLVADTIDKKQLEEEFAKYRAITAGIQLTSETAILDAALAVLPADRVMMLTPAPAKKRGGKQE